ncbi:MAG: sensor domain-containing diguanylate cyclase [Clostridia bacterium]|nr:sensor domain-containing diguanylate cyclase [Clostridia bacterium]
MEDDQKSIAALKEKIQVLEKELKRLKRFEEALDAAGFDIWENNFATGEAIGSNIKLFTSLGYGPDEIPQSVEELLAIVHPVDQEKALAIMENHFKGETDRYKAELRVKAKDGNWVWMGNYGQVKERNEKGEVTRFIGVNFDIDQRRIMEETMKSMAYTDDLTSLGNRRMLFETGHVEVEKALRYNRPLSIIFADIDRFKYINDTYGHMNGDEVLKDYATCLLQSLRLLDSKYRYGGDEFIILLPETTLEEAYDSALRFNQQVKEMTTAIPIVITTSIGVASLTTDDTLESLIKKADLALYKAKEQGKDTVLKG